MHLARELAIAALLVLSSGANAMYSKSSPVVQVDVKNFKKEVLQSDHAVIVEFYAPWCGHCKNLKPAYEKAAKSLKGLAKVAAMDCDEDANKQTCGQYGVQGFPTLKTFKPSAKKGKPVIEDYQGARTAKAIADAIIDKIPNHVTRVTAAKLDKFLAAKNESAKALLFSTKGTSPPLWKGLAIDFLGSIEFAQVRDKEKAAIEVFGVTKFPSVIVLPGGNQEGIVYNGNIERDALAKFLETVNPKTEAPKASASVEDEEPVSSEKPIPSEKSKPTLRTVADVELVAECLSPKSKACALIIGSAPGAEAAHEKFASRPPPHTFRFFKVSETPATVEIKTALGLSSDKSSVIVVNAYRNWWRLFHGDASNEEEVLEWLDQVKMGEGKKEKLPAGLVHEEPEVESVDEALKEEKVKDTAEEEELEKEAKTTQDKVEEERKHDEL